MNLYSIELQLVATAYIKAESPGEALAIARKLEGSSPTILDHQGDVPISGLRFGNRALPAVSLSPAMTIEGLASSDAALAQEGVPAPEPQP